MNHDIEIVGSKARNNKEKLDIFSILLNCEYKNNKLK